MAFHPPTLGESTPGPRELKLLVARKETVAEGVVELWLRDPANAPLPPWEPGAHVDLVLGDDLVRQYSLCGDPGDTAQYQVAVLLAPDGRGGSRHVHDHLYEGDLVRVQGPRNRFPLVPAGRYLFVAGGIGITPILPMIRCVAARRVPWRLLYGGRTRRSMAFVQQLLDAYPGEVEVRPQDETGLLELDPGLTALRSTADPVVYCCGPTPLLEAAEQACARHDLPLHLERFSASPSALEGPRAAFQVRLARTGITLDVPDDRSISEVLAAAGVSVAMSCEEGICGTCQTSVLAGVPDHRDTVLTAKERAAGDTMTVCVSRSSSPCLVLDL